jgi:hypothetical protein
MMRKQQFIDALYNAGWDAPHDAQHSKIEELHRKLFPVIADLEEELEDAVSDQESTQ